MCVCAGGGVCMCRHMWSQLHFSQLRRLQRAEMRVKASICDIWNKLNKCSTLRGPIMAFTRAWPPYRHEATIQFFDCLCMYVCVEASQILHYYCSHYSRAHQLLKLCWYEAEMGLKPDNWRANYTAQTRSQHQTWILMTTPTHWCHTHSPCSSLLLNMLPVRVDSRSAMSPTFMSMTVCRALVLVGSAWSWFLRWSSWGGTR